MKSSSNITNTKILERAERGAFSIPDLRLWLSGKEITPTREAIHTVMREAAEHDRVDVVKLMIEDGKANPYEEDHQNLDSDKMGMTAFNRAASTGLNVLRYLVDIAFEDIQNGGKRWRIRDINMPTGKYDSTLITYAAKVSPVKTVKAIIDAGADISVVNGSGWNLLHCAAVMPERKEVLQLLVERMKKQGLAGCLEAPSTKTFTASYGKHSVTYPPGLTPDALCSARGVQDPDHPKELESYHDTLTPVAGYQKGWLARVERPDVSPSFPGKI